MYYTAIYLENLIKALESTPGGMGVAVGLLAMNYEMNTGTEEALNPAESNLLIEHDKRHNSEGFIDFLVTALNLYMVDVASLKEKSVVGNLEAVIDSSLGIQSEDYVAHTESGDDSVNHLLFTNKEAKDRFLKFAFGDENVSADKDDTKEQESSVKLSPKKSQTLKSPSASCAVSPNTFFRGGKMVSELQKNLTYSHRPGLRGS